MGCRPSQTEPAGAAHRQQLFKNCSRTAPVPRGPSPRSKLLQHGSPTGGSSPQTSCSCVVSSPRAAALAWGLLLQGLSMGRSLLQATSTCSTGSSSTGCSVEICSMWDPWAAGGQPAPPGASPQATGELQLWHLEHLLPSFCTELGVCRAGSHSWLSQLLLFHSFVCLSVFPFLNMLSQTASFGSSLASIRSLWSQRNLALI